MQNDKHTSAADGGDDGGRPSLRDRIRGWSWREKVLVPIAVAVVGGLLLVVLKPFGLSVSEWLFPTEAAVSGRVVLSSGQPAGGAHLTLDDSDKGNAGPGGDFLITGVHSGEHVLHVTYPGAPQTDKSFTIDKGETKAPLGDITMDQLYDLGYVVERVGDPAQAGQGFTQEYDLYLWIGGTAEELRQVTSVTYTLPRGLPATPITSTDPASQFCYHEHGVLPLSAVNDIGIEAAAAVVNLGGTEPLERGAFPDPSGVQPPDCPVTKTRHGGDGVAPPPSGKVTVPSVVGLTQADAASTLASLGLKPTVVEVNSDGDIGKVTRQSPAAGSLVDKGTHVQISVSKGPANLVTVPDVVGETYEQAASELQQKGFNVASIEVNSDLAKGVVVDQDPTGGSSGPKGSTVTLSVSSGPSTAVVPDVTNKDLGTAEATLKEAGFRTRVVYADTADPSLDGIVISQDPIGSTPLEANSIVALTIGRYTPPTTTSP